MSKFRFLTEPDYQPPDIVPVKDEFTVEYIHPNGKVVLISHPEPKSQQEVFDFMSVRFGDGWEMPPSFEGVDDGTEYKRPNPNYSGNRWNWKMVKV